MSKNGLTTLYQALTEPLGPHLDDETLAEIATAEAAGENVEQAYATPLRHLEICVQCAEAYARLAELLMAATADMAHAAPVGSSVGAELVQRANSIWGRAVEIKAEVVGAWQALRLSLTPQASVSTLHGEQIGSVWALFSQNFGQPLPLTIEVRATRLTELTSRVEVRVDRLGLINAAGREVQITFDDQERSATTNEQGVAYFEAVPIAALAQWTIRVQTMKK